MPHKRKHPSAGRPHRGRGSANCFYVSLSVAWRLLVLPTLWFRFSARAVLRFYVQRRVWRVVNPSFAGLTTLASRFRFGIHFQLLAHRHSYNITWLSNLVVVENTAYVVFAHFGFASNSQRAVIYIRAL